VAVRRTYIIAFLSRNSMAVQRIYLINPRGVFVTTAGPSQLLMTTAERRGGNLLLLLPPTVFRYLFCFYFSFSPTHTHTHTHTCTCVGEKQQERKNSLRFPADCLDTRSFKNVFPARNYIRRSDRTSSMSTDGGRRW